MKRLLLASLAIAALAACSKTEAPADTAAPPAEVAQKRMAMPDCATVQAEDTPDGWKNVDCRLQMTGHEFAFEVRYTPSGVEGAAPKQATIEVVQPGDATVQTITEAVENTFNAPSLQDLDGDGFEELLVPLSTGNVNTNYAIWHSPPGGNQFIRLGEVSAYGFEPASGGYLGALSRSAANIQNVAFLKIANGELSRVATVEITAQGEPDKVTGVTCVVTDDGGLAAAGLTLETATATFCEDPLVKGAFQ
jgi:hypothetical protein